MQKPACITISLQIFRFSLLARCRSLVILVRHSPRSHCTVSATKQQIIAFATFLLEISDSESKPAMYDRIMYSSHHYGD